MTTRAPLSRTGAAVADRLTEFLGTFLGTFLGGGRAACGGGRLRALAAPARPGGGDVGALVPYGAHGPL